LTIIRPKRRAAFDPSRRLLGQRPAFFNTLGLADYFHSSPSNRHIQAPPGAARLSQAPPSSAGRGRAPPGAAKLRQAPPPQAKSAETRAGAMARSGLAMGESPAADAELSTGSRLGKSTRQAAAQIGRSAPAWPPRPSSRPRGLARKPQPPGPRGGLGPGARLRGLGREPRGKSARLPKRAALRLSGHPRIFASPGHGSLKPSSR
jgi:hypothetical protein